MYKIYTLLYDNNTYMLANEMLNNRFASLSNSVPSVHKIIFTYEDMLGLKASTFGCLLIDPRPIGSELLHKFILDIITQIKTNNYQFISLIGVNPINLNYDNAIAKDILVVKAIVLVLESIYLPS